MFHTFYTCGPKLYAALKDNDMLQGFKFRFWRNETPLECYIHAICGHMVKIADSHKLCRACDFVAHRKLCYKPDECDVCLAQSPKQRMQRQDRAGRSDAPWLITVIGGRQEARSLIGRWHYLEGILWCLASVYEQRINVEALMQCRRNITALHALRLPLRACPPRRNIEQDKDQPGDTPHVPVQAQMEGSASRREDSTVAQALEELPDALDRLTEEAEAAPITGEKCAAIPVDQLGQLLP